MILAEARAAMASEWVLWPEEIRYDKDSNAKNDWRVFPFMYVLLQALSPSSTYYPRLTHSLTPLLVPLSLLYLLSTKPTTRYTFPADDPSQTKYVEACCALCPQTVALLKRVPGVRTALLSKLGPGTVLGAHRGWADLSNHILRTHLGLIVPGDGAQCGTWVQGEVRRHHARTRTHWCFFSFFY